jgi:hypothetical protein
MTDARIAATADERPASAAQMTDLAAMPAALADDDTLAEAAQYWLDAGLDTTPTDRDAAARAVVRAYASAGLPAPAHIVWADSPHAGVLAVAELTLGKNRGSVTTSLAEQGCVSGVVKLGASVRARVRTRPWAAARAALVEALGPVGFARHWSATVRRPWQQLIDQVATPVRRRLADRFSGTGDFDAAARIALLDVVLGQQDGAWLGAFSTRTPAGDDDVAGGWAVPEELAGLAEVARHAGWWWPYENVALLTPRPAAIHRDNLGRLHHDDGPALSFVDGWGLHAWRGMPLPPDVVAELEHLTVERIQAEENAEVRRVMLEHFGFDRYLKESKATEVGRDECGILWRIRFPNDEPLVMVEVVNSTAEPDGTFRTYFLRVPPDLTSARQAVAWTFDVDPETYTPLVQT